MKRILALASLLLASATCGTALAQSVGYVGNVTLNLTVSYAEGGFKDGDGNPTSEKEISSARKTGVLVKTVLKKARYSNKEFLADLVAKGTLSGTAADWSLRYVETGYIAGFFGVRKSGQVVYLGGLRVDEDEPILIQNRGGTLSIFSGNQTANYKTSVKTPENLKDFGYSYSGEEISTIAFILRPTADSDDDIDTVGVRTEASSYSFNYVVATDKETQGYTRPRTSLTQLVGDSDDEDGANAIVNGEVQISPLKETADTSAYEAAYPYEPLLGG